MLAKELKIKTLKKQREFIKRELSDMADNSADGNVYYLYIGNLYSDVIEYFEKEGFDVKRIEYPERCFEVTKGLPAHLFTIKNTHMNEKERVQAEEYEPEKKDEVLEIGTGNPLMDEIIKCRTEQNS